MEEKKPDRILPDLKGGWRDEQEGWEFMKSLDWSRSSQAWSRDRVSPLSRSVTLSIFTVFFFPLVGREFAVACGNRHYCWAHM